MLKKKSGLERLVGKRIKELRTMLGKTQVELSKETGFTRGYISQVEHGGSSISIYGLIAISYALRTGSDDIIKYAAKKYRAHKY